MRTAALSLLVALPALTACGGNACRQLCEAQEDCGGGDAGTCYSDNYSVLLSLPGTRELTLSTCRSDLEAMGDCAVDSDTQ